MGTTLDGWLRGSSRTLAAAGVPSPQADAIALAAHVLGVPASEVRRRAIVDRNPLEGETLQHLDDAAARRARRVPLQHITGRAPFRRLGLQVGPGVFVPRPETELVAEQAIHAAQDSARLTARTPIVVDLCTGSGAVALAVADEVADAQVWAVEVDPAALHWAHLNCDALPAGQRVTVVDGDARTALPELDGSVDVVVSNPPYVPPDAIPRDPEVADYDPPLALYGLGDDGLHVPRAVASRAARLLRPGGTFVMEHADDQGPAVRAMLDSGTWRQVRTLPDLTGRPRMVVAVRSGGNER